MMSGGVRLSDAWGFGWGGMHAGEGRGKRGVGGGCLQRLAVHPQPDGRKRLLVELVGNLLGAHNNNRLSFDNIGCEVQPRKRLAS